jgi:flagellar motility protein MotE (MotC chaperone)
VKAEYCFYDSRYKFCLEKLFAAVRQGYQNNSREAETLIQKYLLSTQTFNQRVNDLTQIMNAITEDGLRASNNINQDIKDFNAKIQEQKKKLAEQRALITSSQATTTIRKQMVKYTEEKARRSDNLLKTYGFLNIVALGLLVYIYRAVPE